MFARHAHQDFSTINLPESANKMIPYVKPSTQPLDSASNAIKVMILAGTHASLR
jgi:hypothetical protein